MRMESRYNFSLESVHDGEVKQSSNETGGTPSVQTASGYVIFQFVMNVITDGSLSVVGLACNIICILVLQMDRKKMSMTILLQGLAVSDSLFLCYTFLYTTLRSVYLTVGAMKDYYDASSYIIAYVLPCGWISQTTSIWLVLLVTVDRYIAVCKPFRAVSLCTKRNARKVVIVAWTVSVLFNLPRFFYYQQNSFANSVSYNSTFVSHMQIKSQFWNYYRTVYHIGITLLLLFGIPLPLLVVFNACLIRTIARARRRQVVLTGTRAERDSFGVTFNLVVVVTVFVICQTPDFIASIITLDQFSVDKKFLSYYLCVKEALLVLSASTNFLIYCLFYAKFRRILKSLILHLCKTGALEYDSQSQTEKHSLQMSHIPPSSNLPTHGTA